MVHVLEVLFETLKGQRMNVPSWRYSCCNEQDTERIAQLTPETRLEQSQHAPHRARGERESAETA